MKKRVRENRCIICGAVIPKSEILCEQCKVTPITGLGDHSVLSPDQKNVGSYLGVIERKDAHGQSNDPV